MPTRLPKDLQVEEWLKRVRDDELNARSILKHRDGTPSGVCFMSQQMAEKLLKSFLVDRQKSYPKVHSLGYLLTLCVELDDSFKEIRKVARDLDKLYVDIRYPGDVPVYSWKDAEEAYEAALKVKVFVLDKLGIAEEDVGLWERRGKGL
jgi:HEPN domain-containing protein